MPDDVSIKWGSSGFEKVQQDFQSFEKLVDKMKSAAESFVSGFGKVSQVGAVAEKETARIRNFGDVFRATFDNSRRSIDEFIHPTTASIGTLMDHFSNLASVVVKVGVAFAGLAAIGGGAALAVVGEFGKKVIDATEDTKKLEVSLYGATQSWKAVGTATKFAEEYSKDHEVTTHEVLRGLRELAFIPALKPMIVKGDVDAMKAYMETVEKLTLIRPEHGIEGAEMALRQAMMGRWFTLQRQYGVQPDVVAGMMGTSKKALEATPETALKGVETWTSRTMGMDALAASSKEVGKQLKMIHATYTEWLEAIGKTGIYDKVVGYLTRLREGFREFMQTEQMRKFTGEINSLFESIADTIARVFSKGIDWKAISGSSDLWDAIKQIGSNIKEELSKIWEKIKDPLAEGIKKALVFAANASLAVAREVFVPLGEAIAEGMYKGLTEAMQKHPVATLFGAGMVGASQAPGGPLGKGIGAAVMMELVALPNQLEMVKKAWSAYSDFMEGLGERSGINRAIRRILGKEEAAGAVTGAYPTLEEHGMAERRAARREETFYGEEEHGWRERIAARREFATIEPPPWTTTGEQKFSQYKLWEHMGAILAKAPVGPEEPTTASYLFATGKIKEPEYFQRRKMEEFGEERQKKLEEIVGTPGIEEETKSKVYQEMFGVAAGKGDFGKAQEYMNKSLDAMVEAQHRAAEKAGEVSQAQKDTAANTKRMREIMEEEKGKAKETPAESPSITPRYDPQIQPDDIRAENREVDWADIGYGYTNQ